MKYSTQDNGNYGDDASLRGIESATEEEQEGFGIPGQSMIGTVGVNTGGPDGSDTAITNGEEGRTVDVEKAPVEETILEKQHLREFGGVPMSLASRIAYVIENGEPFCNHCEKTFIPTTMVRMACTNCGCGKPNDDHGLIDNNFKHVEGPTVADEAPREIIKEESKLANTEDYLNLFKKQSSDSDLYHKGYSDAMSGTPLDEDLSLLSDDYFNGYQQYKFFNKTPQQSAGQSLYNIKPNSNSNARNFGDSTGITPGQADAGPLQLTDGQGRAAIANKLPFPVDVIQNFFEV